MMPRMPPQLVFRPYTKSRLHWFASVAAALLFLTGCRSVAPPRPSLDEGAKEYLRIVVALGERDPDSLDFYFGSEEIVRAARQNPPKLAELQQQAESLRARLVGISASSPEEESRKTFLSSQVEALALRTELLAGRNRIFDEESRIFFGVVAPHDNNSISREATRRELAALLGQPANHPHAYSTFDAGFLVPREKVPALMDAALRSCRTETLRHVSLPVGEHVEVQYVFHKPWSAFSRYLGHAQSVIQVNMDHPLTVDRIFNLACHEGYPGHHTFNTLRDEALVQQAHRLEWTAQPTFSPQSFLSEAAASYAPELAFSDLERLRVERDVLFPLAGLDSRKAAKYLQVERLIEALQTAEPEIARNYLDGRVEFVRTSGALERETLMEHNEAFLLYLNEYRTYMLTYTLGHDQVRNYVTQGSANPAQQWKRYQMLATQPLSAVPDRSR